MSTGNATVPSRLITTRLWYMADPTAALLAFADPISLVLPSLVSISPAAGTARWLVSEATSYSTTPVPSVMWLQNQARSRPETSLATA